jgi:NAD(P)-dependent dehydrogenase (short-subunit alcohol dehydrogenase family)
MTRTAATDKWIINVSSMEGQFYKIYKGSTHPHTNMAKAALNMMTRTCGSDFATDRIWMNSVDTGWVSDENPNSWNREFTCPLDELDGAMRVLDPIFTSVQTGKNCHSLFFKDYQSVLW